MNGAAFLGVDVDERRIRRRVETGYCDRLEHDLDAALRAGRGGAGAPAARSRSAWWATSPRCCPSWSRRGRRARRGHRPDLGARPARGLHPRRPLARRRPPDCASATRPATRRAVLDSMVVHVRAMLDSARPGRGGLRLRQQPAGPGGRPPRACARPSTSPASCPRSSGRCSAAARARSAGPRSRAIRPTSPRPTRRCWRPFPQNDALARWIRQAQERVQFQGLPARICWLEYGERAEMGAAVQLAGEARQGRARRSSSGATTSTPARWRRPTARPRR